MQWFSAVVRDNADKDKRLRLRLRIPELYGDDDAPEWVAPLLPGGLVFGVPAKDSIVLVLYAEGSLRWVGCEVGGKRKLPSDLADGYPRRAGFFSSIGDARVVLEDGERGQPARAYVLAGEVRVASSIRARVEKMILGDTFLGDYITVRNVVVAFLTSCQSAVTAANVAAYATTAVSALNAAAPAGSAPATRYEAAVGRVE